jgi:hypothetical protein
MESASFVFAKKRCLIFERRTDSLSQMQILIG